MEPLLGFEVRGEVVLDVEVVLVVEVALETLDFVTFRLSKVFFTCLNHTFSVLVTVVVVLTTTTAETLAFGASVGNLM